MNRFKSMFDVVSKENADATTIPVVLELDVQPAEGSADVAADPATEPATTAAATTEPAAAEGEDLGQAEGDEEGETTAVELAEAEAEHSELMNEIEVVEDVAEKVESDAADVKESLDANDQAVAEGKEEVITPANVAIATQAFELRLERLGLSLTDLCPSANISKETFISKEEGGLGMKPSEVLRNLHNEISREDGVLDKIKAGAKKVWDAIVSALKKIVDFVAKLLPTQKNKLIKMGELVEGAKIESAEINVGQIAPGMVLANKFDYTTKDVLAALDASINANNDIIKAANQNDNLTSHDLVKIFFNAYKGFPMIEDRPVIAIHRHNIYLGHPRTFVEAKPIDKTDKKETIYKNRLKKLIDDQIAFQPQIVKRTEDYKKLISNLEKIVKVENSKMKGFITNVYIKAFYSKLYKVVVKTYNEQTQTTIDIAKEFLKADKEANK